MNNHQVSYFEYQNRKINLLPILLAQQLVLLPLYFFIPIWIFIFNILITAVVYFTRIKSHIKLSLWLKVVFTIAAFAGVLISFHQFTGRDAGVALIAIMYGLKILEIKSPRDVYILLFLGFFLLLAGFLFNQSPLISLYQIIPIFAILNALISIHLIPTNINLLESKLEQNNKWYLNVFSESLLPTLKSLSKYLVLALPLMVVLFVFFPRLSGPIWKMPGSSNGTSGISDSMTPGDMSSLQLSQKIAFRVKFNERTPPVSEMYWRVLVLDRYDGLTWSRHSDAKKIISKESLASLKRNESDKNYYNYDISLEKTNQKWLTFLDRPVSTPARTKVFSDYTVQLPYHQTDRVRYKAASILKLTMDLQLTSKQRKINTLLPQNFNKKSLDWARNKRQSYSDDKKYIFSLLKQINRNEYFYTLRPPIMKEDTVDDFWFEQRRGFCEHYAGSLVFLARAANIPARVVIGYQGAEKNPLSDYWIVRYANAHAWTEVWFEGEGWLRIDPTAAIAQHRIEEELQQDYRQRNSLFEVFGFDAIDLNDVSWLKNIQFWLDQADSGWNDWVLDYNQNQQRKLFNGLGFNRLTNQQISFLMVALLGLFLALMTIKWVKPAKYSDDIQKSFMLLVLKLKKKGVLLNNTQGASDLMREIQKNMESASCNLIEKTEDVNARLENNSALDVIRILKRYVYLRYQIQQVTDKQQKSFQREVKALIIRTHSR